MSGGTAVDFEDLVGSPSITASDWNCGDAKVFVSNTMATPEPLPFAAFGMGIVGLVFRRRR